ncbi:glycosyltransferase family 8 protein [Auriscalpium vulgare]|uniref:Glycosyltransferase family 8 protein n=1 Tax=Auriscalpium vulgare TaxID=40419 RepID=A0ACB8S7Z5_9AGAM|nr:glycosyltransferase family 8 protein [Auriscalpium vulgare]
MASPYAFVSLLTSDSYLPGALTLAAALRDVHPSPAALPEVDFQTVCLVTPETVDVSSIKLLRKAFNVVIGVEILEEDNARGLQLLGRPDLTTVLTKLHAFRLTQYSKVIFLDADILPTRPLSHLFTLPHEFSAVPDVGWPDIFNSGLLVFSPGEDKFNDLMTLSKTKGSWDGGDQGLLNEWRGSNWNRLSFIYNTTPTAVYTYAPAYERFGSQISAIHFIGPNKPWSAIPWRAPGSKAAQEAASEQLRVYDYGSLLDRWFAVYDRHYRSAPVVTPTEYASRRYEAAWDQEASIGAEAVAPPLVSTAAAPFGLDELRRIAIEGFTGVGGSSMSASGDGEYLRLPLEGRFDLMRPKYDPALEPRAPSAFDVPPGSGGEDGGGGDGWSGAPHGKPAGYAQGQASQQGYFDPSGSPSTPRASQELLHGSPPRMYTLPTPGPNEVPPAPYLGPHSLPPTPTPSRTYHQDGGGSAPSQNQPAGQWQGQHTPYPPSGSGGPPDHAQVSGQSQGGHGFYSGSAPSSGHREVDQGSSQSFGQNSAQGAPGAIHQGSGHGGEPPQEGQQYAPGHDSQGQHRGPDNQGRDHGPSSDQPQPHGHWQEPAHNQQQHQTPPTQQHQTPSAQQYQTPPSQQHQTPPPQQPPRPVSPPMMSWNPAIEPPPNTVPVSNFPTSTYFPNAWDEASDHHTASEHSPVRDNTSPFFAAPPPSRIPERLLQERHYANVLGDRGDAVPSPDRSKVKPVFPWEDSPRHMPGRVFPSSDSPPPGVFLQPVPEASPSPSPPTQSSPQSYSPVSYSPTTRSPGGLPSNFGYMNAWDGVPSIQKYASRLMRSPQAATPLAPAFDIAESRRRESKLFKSWQEESGESSMDGDDEDTEPEEDDATATAKRRSRSGSSSTSAPFYSGKGKSRKEYRSQGVQTIPKDIRHQGVQVALLAVPSDADRDRSAKDRDGRPPGLRSRQGSYTNVPSKRNTGTGNDTTTDTTGVGETYMGAARISPTLGSPTGMRSPRIITSPPNSSQNLAGQVPALSKPVPPKASTPLRQSQRATASPILRTISSSDAASSPSSAGPPVSPSDLSELQTPPVRRVAGRVWDPARGVDIFKKGSEEVLARFLRMGSWEEERQTQAAQRQSSSPV